MYRCDCTRFECKLSLHAVLWIFSQVIRLLTKVRVAPSRSTVREKLQKYSFVRTWADRSETVVALRNASLGKVSVGCLSFACCQCARIFVAWLEFFHGLIGVVYTLFVQPFWLALVDHCRLRRFRAIRWCHGDASTSFPSSNGLHEPLTFEKSTEWSSQSSSRLRSKPFGAAVRSECSKYPRRVMCVHCMLLFHCECLCASTFRSKFARLGKSVWGLVLESVRCTVVLTKQVHCLCTIRSPYHLVSCLSLCRVAGHTVGQKFEK